MLEKLTHSWSLAKSRPDVEGQGPPRRGSNASNVSWDNQLVDSPTLGCSPQKRSHSQEFWKDPATYTFKVMQVIQSWKEIPQNYPHHWHSYAHILTTFLQDFQWNLKLLFQLFKTLPNCWQLLDFPDAARHQSLSSAGWKVQNNVLPLCLLQSFDLMSPSPITITSKFCWKFRNPCLLTLGRNSATGRRVR